MTYAFFRGFMVGADDERAQDVVCCPRGCAIVAPNPYLAGATARYWNLGRDLGLKAAGE